MKYQYVGNNDYVLRIDRGNEITQAIKMFCVKEHITFGTVQGIGALSQVKVGLYRVDESTYYAKEFNGAFEITSLMGNVIALNDEIYLHLHIAFADSNYNVYGGHLNEGIIGATGEIFIHKLDYSVTRIKDEATGLNILNI